MRIEEYVSFETAKLLKRAGFDWDVYYYYDIESDCEECNESEDEDDFNFFDNQVSRPSLCQAASWCFEEHDIRIEVFFNVETHRYDYEINVPKAYFPIAKNDFEKRHEAWDSAIAHVARMFVPDEDNN